MSDKLGFHLAIFHETEKGLLVGFEPLDRESEKAISLPKSQVTWKKTGMSMGCIWADFVIPQWLADKKGISHRSLGEVDDPDDDFDLVEDDE